MWPCLAFAELRQLPYSKLPYFQLRNGDGWGVALTLALSHFVGEGISFNA